jgi:phage terminase large subunit-like protein
MHEALERFLTDLHANRIRHDGCPLTASSMGNARKLAKLSDRYLLGKPSQTQKIDPTMASVLAHEAAADARAAGWDVKPDSKLIFFTK